MNHRLLYRLATVLTLTLGVLGLASQPGNAGPGRDPCGSSSAISISDFIMWDGTSGGSANLLVSARVPCVVARTISYRTYDITARAGEDYVGVNNATFVFPAGKTSTTLTIHIIGDTIPEPPESFGVRLLDGATFDDPEAIVTIVDR